MKRPALVLSLSMISLAAALPFFACGVCGCAFNSDWVSQGYQFGTGFNLNLRFDYIDQDQLRTGRTTVNKGSILFPSEQEIQLRTISRTTLLDLGYSPNADWSVNAFVPVTDRTHGTVGEGDLTSSYSHSSGIGDLMLLGRYQGFSMDRSFGLQLGVKLPTGRTGDTFSTGPLAGETVDRGLQLGTGTTDLLVGAYKFGTFRPKWGYFVSALAQFPTGGKDGFRPGDALNLSAGARYTGFDVFTPQIQLNLRAETPETGASADTANSGSTLAYLSPGLTASINSSFQLFAFLQVPVYQRVSGYQLEPRYLLSVGLNYRF